MNNRQVYNEYSIYLNYETLYENLYFIQITKLSSSLENDITLMLYQNKRRPLISAVY